MMPELSEFQRGVLRSAQNQPDMSPEKYSALETDLMMARLARWQTFFCAAISAVDIRPSDTGAAMRDRVMVAAQVADLMLVQFEARQE